MSDSRKEGLLEHGEGPAPGMPVKNLTNMSQEELDQELAKMKQYKPGDLPQGVSIADVIGESAVPAAKPTPNYAQHLNKMEQIHAKQIERLAIEGNPHAVTLYNAGVLISANGPRNTGYDMVAIGTVGEADRIYRLVDLIDTWGRERQLVRGHGSTALAQMKKLKEEVQEIEDAILLGNEIEMVDGIGDSLTVIIQLCRLTQVPLEEALERAYSQIRYRTGKMVDGVFVKDSK